MKRFLSAWWGAVGALLAIFGALAVGVLRRG